MNLRIASLAAAVILSASSVVPALATEARLQAAREDFATKCTWVQDNVHRGNLRVRLLSFAVATCGWKAALVAKPGQNGTPLKQISFEIHYTSQMARHLAPSIVIETRDAQNKPVFTRFNQLDVERRSVHGNRILTTLDLVAKYGHPVTVHQIAIGGNEQIITGNGYTMDCSICNFTAIDANGTALKNTVDTGVRVLNRNSEPILLPEQNLGEGRYGTPRLASAQ